MEKNWRNNFLSTTTITTEVYDTFILVVFHDVKKKGKDEWKIVGKVVFFQNAQDNHSTKAKIKRGNF